MPVNSEDGPRPGTRHLSG